jgi:D-threo-aldose 1-dehydrogenase
MFMRKPLTLSPLGFGCASVMGKTSGAQAVRAMAEAFEHGVTHFDVARSYGFGRAEKVVGTFIKNKRDQVTITTKFGVVPPNLRLTTRAMIPIARGISRFLPPLNSRMRSKSGQLLADRNYTLTYARQCLHQSLRELATDYIDIFLIHEPDAASLGEVGLITAFLEDSIQAGKIRRWGFAYHSPQDDQWGRLFGGDVIQFEANVQTIDTCRSLSGTPRQKIVTRPFAGDIDRMFAAIPALSQRAASDALEMMGASLADLALCLAHRVAGSAGTILCSMFSLDHVRNNVQSIRRFSMDDRMNQLIDSLLAPCGKNQIAPNS